MGRASRWLASSRATLTAGCRSWPDLARSVRGQLSDKNYESSLGPIRWRRPTLSGSAGRFARGRPAGGWCQIMAGRPAASLDLSTWSWRPVPGANRARSFRLFARRGSRERERERDPQAPVPPEDRPRAHRRGPEIGRWLESRHRSAGSSPDSTSTRGRRSDLRLRLQSAAPSGRSSTRRPGPAPVVPPIWSCPGDGPSGSWSDGRRPTG